MAYWLCVHRYENLVDITTAGLHGEESLIRKIKRKQQHMYKLHLWMIRKIIIRIVRLNQIINHFKISSFLFLLVALYFQNLLFISLV